jgi:hypothetical protein
VRRRALALGRERPLALAPQLGEAIVVQEPGVAQRHDQPARRVRDGDLPGQARQRRAQVALVLLAVEAGEAAREQRRDQQRDLGESERIAHDEARLLAQRRRHDVEIGAEARQGGCHPRSA